MVMVMLGSKILILSVNNVRPVVQVVVEAGGRSVSVSVSVSVSFAVEVE